MIHGGTTGRSGKNREDDKGFTDCLVVITEN